MTAKNDEVKYGMRVPGPWSMPCSYSNKARGSNRTRYIGRQILATADRISKSNIRGHKVTCCERSGERRPSPGTSRLGQPALWGRVGSWNVSMTRMILLVMASSRSADEESHDPQEQKFLTRPDWKILGHGSLLRSTRQSALNIALT